MNPMTEHEIAEVFAPILVPYLIPCESATGTRQQQAVFVASRCARAVAERVVMPTNTDCLSAGCMEDRVHALAKELGYMEELQALLADRDTRLAELAVVCQRHGCMWEAHEGQEIVADRGEHAREIQNLRDERDVNNRCWHDAEDRLARLVEVLKQADRIITEVIGRERGDIISTLGIELRAISVLDELRAALADAGAEKERSDEPCDD